MKNWIILLFICSTYSIKAQLFSDITDSKNGTKTDKIITVKYDNFIDRFSLNWQISNFYNDDNIIKSQDQFKSKKIIPRLNNKKIAYVPIPMYELEINISEISDSIYYSTDYVTNDIGQITQADIWLHNLMDNSKYKSSSIQDILYEDNQIVAFDEIEFSNLKEETGFKRFKMTYNDKKQLQTVEIYEKKDINHAISSINSTLKKTFIYDSKGQIKKCLFDGKECMRICNYYKYIIYLKYDKKGNWTKQFVKETGLYGYFFKKLSKRKIFKKRRIVYR